jgi:hypothetical protein
MGSSGFGDRHQPRPSILGITLHHDMPSAFQLPYECGEVSPGHKERLRKIAHAQALRTAIKRCEHIEAGKGGVKLFGKTAPETFLDDQGAGEEAEPQTHRSWLRCAAIMLFGQMNEGFRFATLDAHPLSFGLPNGCN